MKRLLDTLWLLQTTLLASNVDTKTLIDQPSTSQPNNALLVLTVSYTVATHLENLEKSGNLRVVREKSGENRKSRGKCVLACMKVGQLVVKKIAVIVATRCQILWLKCTKFEFGWGCAPDPAGGAYGPVRSARNILVLETADLISR